MSTTPWNGDAVAIVKSDEGAMLTIVRAKASHNPNMVFETMGENAQLESLFATLAGSKRPIRCTNFVMYGEERGDNGRPKAIVAKHRQKYDAKDGTEKEANYAYDPAQLDKFVPLSFAVVTKWIKKDGRNIPVPLFMAHATPYERNRATQDMGFQRITVAKASADAPIVRKAGRKT